MHGVWAIMIDITRYDINEHGEIPLSNGRYVRWEDVEDLLKEMQENIDDLENDLASAESPCCDYDAGYQEGYLNGQQDGIKIGMRQAAEIIVRENR